MFRWLHISREWLYTNVLLQISLSKSTFGQQLICFLFCSIDTVGESAKTPEDLILQPSSDNQQGIMFLCWKCHLYISAGKNIFLLCLSNVYCFFQNKQCFQKMYNFWNIIQTLHFSCLFILFHFLIDSLCASEINISEEDVVLPQSNDGKGILSSLDGVFFLFRPLRLRRMIACAHLRTLLILMRRALFHAPFSSSFAYRAPLFFIL